MPERVCVLASGGLDSAVLVATLARRAEVHPVHVACGLRWERAEVASLRRFLRSLPRSGLRAAPLVRLSLPAAPLYGRRHWSIAGRRVPGARAATTSNHLPGRNLLLASLAAVHCVRHRIPTIALAVLADNPFVDASPAFLRALGRTLGMALGAPIAIRAPFRRLTKAQLVRRGRTLPLGLTVSCAAPRGRRHCGRCTKCAERRRAFGAAGVPDPTDYASGPGLRRGR